MLCVCMLCKEKHTAAVTASYKLTCKSRVPHTRHCFYRRMIQSQFYMLLRETTCTPEWNFQRIQCTQARTDVYAYAEFQAVRRRITEKVCSECNGCFDSSACRCVCWNPAMREVQSCLPCTPRNPASCKRIERVRDDAKLLTHKKMRTFPLKSNSHVCQTYV